VSIQHKIQSQHLPFCLRVLLVHTVPQLVRFAVTELGLVSKMPPVQDGSMLLILGDNLIEVRGTGCLVDVDPLQRLLRLVAIFLGSLLVLAVTGIFEMSSGTTETSLAWQRS
jgi:hypothetical protein